jgi:hypothetical protein
MKKDKKSDKRVWRGRQRQIAREWILEGIKDILVTTLGYNSPTSPITPADAIRKQELESIAAMIKRRRLKQRDQ